MTHDILVLGAGPAGSVAAQRLAAAGARVVLVGAASRPGWEGLSNRSRILLDEEGLDGRCGCIDGPFVRRGAWAGGRSIEGIEWLVERSELAEALRGQARAAGADDRRDGALGLVRVEGHWQAQLRAGGRVRAPLLIDARGRRGPERRGPLLLAFGRCFRRRAPGAGDAHWSAAVAAGTHIHALDFGWCWWAERGDGLWVQVVGRPRSGPSAGWFAAAAAQIPALAASLSHASAAGDPVARPAHARLGIAECDPSAWRVGDSAMALDPLSGQGVYEALRGGRSVATAVQSVLEGGDAMLAHRFVEERYEESWQRGVRIAADLYGEYGERPGFWADTAAAYAALRPAALRFEPRIERRPVLLDRRIVEREVVVTPENPRGVWHVSEVPLADLKRHFETVERATVAGAALALRRPQTAVAVAFDWLRTTGALPRHHAMPVP